MTDFKRAPDWDVKYKSADRGGRLAAQREPGGASVVYMSNYANTLDFLTTSKRLNRELYTGASRLMRTLKGEVGRAEGTGGYHLQDALKMRRIRKGGRDGDRQAYHIYVVNATPDPNNPGNAFISAEMQSQFTREAWKERMKTDKDGKRIGQQRPPNRHGWVGTSLLRVSGGKQTKKG